VTALYISTQQQHKPKARVFATIDNAGVLPCGGKRGLFNPVVDGNNLLLIFE